MSYLSAEKLSISSDEELMAFLVSGCENAFEELYKRYSKRMLGFFYLRLYNDKDKAQDFLQDLFIKIIEKGGTYKSDKSFKVWIYALASNMCKNEYRKLTVRGVKVCDFDFNQLLDEAPSVHLKDKFDRNLFNELLARELHLLDERQSLTFALRYQNHLSVKEISEIMNCAEGTVKSRLFYTIKQLSQKLNMFNPYKEFSDGDI